MGHIGMRYSLPSRELIADAAETVINAHWFDGVFYIPNCDKITPGMILAAMRTNVPAVFCSGGPMKGGVDMTGHQATLSSLFEAVGTYQSGDMSKEELDYLEKNACPTCGSCSGMFTANSMNCLMEVLGLALPGNGTILAVSDERRELVRQAATKLMDNIKNNVRPRDIVTKEAIDDAFALDMAMGQPIPFFIPLLLRVRLVLTMTLRTLMILLRRHLISLKLLPPASIPCMMYMKQVVFQPLLIS